MQKQYRDKAIKSAENKEETKVETEEEYFFPEHQITIKANSREEAEAKLKAELAERGE